MIARVAALALAPGDVVWRWWDSGISWEIQPLRVVRINRQTVTVETEQGSTFRAPCEQIEGRYTQDDARFTPAQQQS